MLLVPRYIFIRFGYLKCFLFVGNEWVDIYHFVHGPTLISTLGPLVAELRSALLVHVSHFRTHSKFKKLYNLNSLNQILLPHPPGVMGQMDPKRPEKDSIQMGSNENT